MNEKADQASTKAKLIPERIVEFSPNFPHVQGHISQNLTNIELFLKKCLVTRVVNTPWLPCQMRQGFAIPDAYTLLATFASSLHG